jgi:hypothetical protein
MGPAGYVFTSGLLRRVNVRPSAPYLTREADINRLYAQFFFRFRNNRVYAQGLESHVTQVTSYSHQSLVTCQLSL